MDGPIALVGRQDMAVLCGAISVVIRAERIIAAFPTSLAWAAFVPNDTLTTDGELFRLGFLTSLEATHFVRSLEPYALRRPGSGYAGDFAVTDQDCGPTAPCDWIEFGRLYLGGTCPVAAARLRDSTCPYLAGPRDSRLSATFDHPSEQIDTNLRENFFKLLHADHKKQIYADPISGKEIVVSRPHRVAVAVSAQATLNDV